MSISELLLAPDAVADALARPDSDAARLVQLATECGVRLWLYAAALPDYRACAPVRSLPTLIAHCQWLSALACDVDLECDDPLPEMFARACARLGPHARWVTARVHRLALSPRQACDALQGLPTIPFVDLTAQQDRIRPELERRIDAVLRHGTYIMGPEVVELERALAARVGVAHAITCGSGTVSLEIALRALGIGAGDEVITTAFSWISTAEVIALVGATPVFVDIDPDTYCIAPAAVAAAVSARTRAVIAVSLFGQPADIEGIAAAAPGIPIIEDAAQSFGAMRHGRASCGLSLIGSTSFFPAKPLGCYGDGGCLFTNDPVLAERMQAIRNHGCRVRFQHAFLGLNGRLDTIQAAVLLAKLTVWEDELQRRATVAARYDQLLQSPTVVPRVASGNTHVYSLYTIRHPERDRVAARLAAAGIPTAIYYPRPISDQPPFRAAPVRGGLIETERACREVLSLPMHPYLAERLQRRIAQLVNAP